MALTARPTTVVTIDYIDGSGSNGRSVAHLPATTLLADAITKADALVTAITVASDCSVQGYTISTGKTETALISAAPLSRVEHKAILTFRTAAGKKASFSFPAPKAAMILPDGGLLSTQADLALVISDLVGSGWCDSNGSDLTVMIADEEVSERSSKRQITTDTNPLT